MKPVNNINQVKTDWFFVGGYLTPCKRTADSTRIIDACGIGLDIKPGMVFTSIPNSPFPGNPLDKIKTRYFWVSGISSPCTRVGSSALSGLTFTTGCEMVGVNLDMRFKEIPDV